MKRNWKSEFGLTALRMCSATFYLLKLSFTAFDPTRPGGRGEGGRGGGLIFPVDQTSNFMMPKLYDF